MLTFMYDDQPVQLKSTGRFLLNYAIAIADKAQTLGNLQHHVHYNFRIKVRQILLSAADVFETAGGALLNPHNPLDLEQENAKVAEVASPSPPVPTSVHIAKERDGIPSDRAGNKPGNKGDENKVGDAGRINKASNPLSQIISFAKNIQDGKVKRKNSTSGNVKPPSTSSSTDVNIEKVTGKRAKHLNDYKQHRSMPILVVANGSQPPPPKSANHVANTTAPGKTVRAQEKVSQVSTKDCCHSLRNRGGDN